MTRLLRHTRPAGAAGPEHGAAAARKEGSSRSASCDWTLSTGRDSPPPKPPPLPALIASEATASTATLQALFTPEAHSRRGTARSSRRTTSSIARESASLTPAPSPAARAAAPAAAGAAALLPAAQQHLQAGAFDEARAALHAYLAQQLDLGHHVAGPAATAWALDMLGDALLHLGHPAGSALELWASAAGMLAQQCAGGGAGGGEGEREREHMRQLQLKMQRLGGGPAAPEAGDGRQPAAASSAGSAPDVLVGQLQRPPSWQAGDSASASGSASIAPAAAAPGAWRWRHARSPIQLVGCGNGRASPQPPAQAGGQAGLAGTLWRFGAQLLRRAAPAGAAAAQRAAGAAGGAAPATQQASVAGAESFGTACSRSESPAESIAQPGAGAELLALAASTEGASQAPSSAAAAERRDAAQAPQAAQQEGSQQQAAAAGSRSCGSTAGPEARQPGQGLRPGSCSSTRGLGGADAPAGAGAGPAAAAAPDPGLDAAAAALHQLAQQAAQQQGAQPSRADKVDQWLRSCDDREAWQQHLQRLALLQGPGQGTPGWCTPATATASSAVSRSSSAAAWSGTLVSPR